LKEVLFIFLWWSRGYLGPVSFTIFVRLFFAYSLLLIDFIIQNFKDSIEFY